MIMKIAFIDTFGLCYDGTTLTKRGLGGSESAPMTTQAPERTITFGTGHSKKSKAQQIATTF